jgi:hypothetical protein
MRSTGKRREIAARSSGDHAQLEVVRFTCLEMLARTVPEAGRRKIEETFRFIRQSYSDGG